MPDENELHHVAGSQLEEIAVLHNHDNSKLLDSFQSIDLYRYAPTDFWRRLKGTTDLLTT